MKLVYPLYRKAIRSTGSRKVFTNPGSVEPFMSVYDFEIQLSGGTNLSLDAFRNKKLLLVNTASDCGYTAQYEELQRLQDEWGQKVQVVAFPANDFKQQEEGSDEEIAAFCKRHYGVNFPVAKKSSVKKSLQQHPVFQWLTRRDLNGWNDHPPVWNFTKYLVNEQGVLTHCFHPSVSPLDPEIVNAIAHEPQ
ncbi:MAG TPA: glutathione peroxidase [Flavisolibacter sp.]